MVRTNKGLYKTILIAAILDVATGALSLVYSTLPMQILALGVTTITLILSIIHCIKYSKDKKSDTGTLIIGSLDFVTGLISVLVMVLATQVLAVIASSLTFVKAVKVFVQSKKAKKLLDTTKPFISKMILKLAPIFGTWLVSKINNVKSKIKKGDKSFMEKVKEFFAKLGGNIRANKVSLSETLLNGGVWGAVGYLASSVETVAIEVCGINITPYLTILGFILVEIGFQWESFGTFIARISPKLAAKLAEKQAKAEEKAKAEALSQMKKEKESALAEMKAEKLAKEKEEAEIAEKLAKEKEEKELAEWLAAKNAEKAKVEVANAETVSKPINK